MRRFSGILCLVCVAALLVSGCSARPKAHTTYYFDYFDTFSYLTVYTADDDEAARFASITESLLSSYDALLDSYSPHEGVTGLYEVNRAAGSRVTVSPELFSFLEYALQAYEDSLHTVNIALGPVLRLWQAQLSSDHPEVPSRESLETAALHTDPADVLLDKDTLSVCLRYPDMSLDAGALGKGYLCQKVEEALRAAGCTSALFSAGGNVLCIGSAPAEGLFAPAKGFNVGIRNPSPEDTGLYTTWSVTDASVVTSGDYERFFEVNGVRYHHLIDPVTLEPGRLYHSVTVKCRDAAAGDMLSTALFLLSKEDGAALAARSGAEVLYLS